MHSAPSFVSGHDYRALVQVEVGVREGPSASEGHERILPGPPSLPLSS